MKLHHIHHKKPSHPLDDCPFFFIFRLMSPDAAFCLWSFLEDNCMSRSRDKNHALFAIARTLICLQSTHGSCDSNVICQWNQWPMFIQYSWAFISFFFLSRVWKYRDNVYQRHLLRSWNVVRCLGESMIIIVCVHSTICVHNYIISDDSPIIHSS